MTDQVEFDACKSVFEEDVVENRTDIKSGNIVIPRYSALPYYEELEYDCNKMDSTLINSYAQHKWVADFEWYSVEELRKHTFKTYTQDEFIYAPDGEYIVKGVTNSMKWNWNTKMFAASKRDAVKIGCDLREDSLIGSQDIIYREYLPLMTYEEGINGLPFTNEWRFFFLGEALIDYGYYWSIADNPLHKDMCPVGIRKLSNKLAVVCARYVNFFVLDIALLRSGNPILVEINDGSMSGLSSIDENKFYKKLKKLLDKSI